MNKDIIKNRAEVLFLYDITDGNPNGDPIDENKPRIDEETGINIVTDVRLKRTIRDYLHDHKGFEIFIKEVRGEDGKLKTKKDRNAEFSGKEDLLNKCIDIRLFGATTAIENETMTLTGPVQFKFGRSLHRVSLKYIKGTTVMPSGEGREQGTFTEKYILPYSLIAFYGVVNEVAAQKQNIPLTKSDIDAMLEAMWNGTKSLMSTSKMRQMPRLLIYVEYKDKYFIGELDKKIKLMFEKSDEEIRGSEDYSLDITALVNALEAKKDKIEAIEYAYDDYMKLIVDGEQVAINNELKKIIDENKLKKLGFSS
ncbi:type I-B CRISPR-associated protein Cas7/Csh2 [Peptococcaceae bacterium]|nr:type I-B CRISPR-associated protein Cas7/Csh2 [Peptococcaceae bacterium]